MCLAPAPATVMAKELQEADVLRPDHHHSPDDGGRDQRQRQKPHCWPSVVRKPSCPRVDDDDDAAREGSKVRRPAGTAPVAIVIPGPSRAKEDYYYGDDDDEAPPHVALKARRRRLEGRAALSMCEGRGRTLKGRDLQNVRTAVLRMTGFIET